VLGPSAGFGVGSTLPHESKLQSCCAVWQVEKAADVLQACPADIFGALFWDAEDMAL
jgi:hypothetical protein